MARIARGPREALIHAYLEGDRVALGALADRLEDEGDPLAAPVRAGEWWLVYDKPARVRDIERLDSGGVTLSVRGWSINDWFLREGKDVKVAKLRGFANARGAMAHVWWGAVEGDEGYGRILRDVHKACDVAYGQFRHAAGWCGPSYPHHFVGTNRRPVWAEGREVVVEAGSPWRVTGIINWVGGPGPGSAVHRCVLLDREALMNRRGNIRSRMDSRRVSCEMRYGALEEWK